MLFRMFYVARLSVKIPGNDDLSNEFLGLPSGHSDKGIPVKKEGHSMLEVQVLQCRFFSSPLGEILL